MKKKIAIIQESFLDIVSKLCGFKTTEACKWLQDPFIQNVYLLNVKGCWLLSSGGDYLSGTGGGGGFFLFWGGVGKKKKKNADF